MYYITKVEPAGWTVIDGYGNCQTGRVDGFNDYSGSFDNIFQRLLCPSWSLSDLRVLETDKLPPSSQTYNTSINIHRCGAFGVPSILICFTSLPFASPCIVHIFAVRKT